MEKIQGGKAYKGIRGPCIWAPGGVWASGERDCLGIQLTVLGGNSMIQNIFFLAYRDL